MSDRQQWVYVNMRNGKVSRLDNRCRRRDQMTNWVLIEAPVETTGSRADRARRKAAAAVEPTPPPQPPAAPTPPPPPAVDVRPDAGDVPPDEGDGSVGIVSGVVQPLPDPVEVERPAGNASRDVWAEFAESIGVEVTDGMGRDAIRAACPAD